MGALKVDALTVEAMDRIRTALDLLMEYGFIDDKGSLRKTYDAYLHPEVLNYDDEKMWDKTNKGEIPDLFQMETQVGAQCIKKAKPRSVVQLSSINNLMRLMADGEQPIDKFVRHKENIQDWYTEMRSYGLTEEEIKIMEEHLKEDFGVGSSQETMMLLLMDERICGFSIQEANKARKIVGKKIMKDIPILKENVFSQGKGSENLKKYVWETQIEPQLGYSFSDLHSTSYSLIALQEMNIATFYPRIIWDTACLTITAGADEDNENNKSTDYGKIASAISKMRKDGVHVDLPLINKADFGFAPDIEHNRIIFGLRGINGIGDDVAHAIIENRPYSSFDDFHERMYKTGLVKKSQFIMLIKAGAFNEFGTPIEIMKKFLVKEVDVKEALNMQNIKSILKYGLLDTPELSKYKELYYFRQYIMKRVVRVEKTPNPRTKKGYSEDKILGLDAKSTEFFNKMFDSKAVVGYNNNGLEVSEKEFDKQYKKLIEPLKEIIANKEFVNKFNQAQFIELWTQYAQGSVQKWEMEALSYYSNKHELDGVDTELYGISNFFDLSEEPVVSETYINKNGQEINKYKIFTLVGTVVDKNKDRHTFTLITKDGVVTCKTHAGAFAHYDKTISKINSNGKKITLEKSWFTKGSLLLVNGYRRGDQFILKTYKNKGQNNHTINLIKEVEEDGKLILQAERTRI